MIIYKHTAESNQDMSCFYGKIEIEVDNIEEWNELLPMLPNFAKTVDCDTVCHCNIKENAETIAQILDYDNRYEISPFGPFFSSSVEQEGR